MNSVNVEELGDEVPHYSKDVSHTAQLTWSRREDNSVGKVH